MKADPAQPVLEKVCHNVEDQSLLQQLGELFSAVCWKCGERDRQRHPSHESHQGNIYRRLGEEVPAIDHTPEHQEDEQDYESISLNEEEAIKR